MAQQVTPGLVLENLIKTLMERLEIPSQKEIAHLNARLDRLEKLLYHNQPGHPAFTDGTPPPNDSGKQNCIHLCIGNHLQLPQRNRF